MGVVQLVVRATLHAATDRLPPAVALDTSLLFSAIYANQAAHERAWPVYSEMVAQGTTVVVCQPLLLMEAWQVLKKLAGENDGPSLTRLIEDARELMTGQRTLFRDPIPRSITARRAYAVRAGEALLDYWMARLRLGRVRLTYALLDRARENMMQWGLKSHDALWLGVAQTISDRIGGRPAIATTDSDFDRVLDLDVWGRS